MKYVKLLCCVFLCLGAAKSSQLMVPKPLPSVLMPLVVTTNKPPTNCVTLAWDAYPGATNYTVEVVGSGTQISFGNVTWATLCGLREQDANYWVRAYPLQLQDGEMPPAWTSRTTPLRLAIPPPSTNVVTVTAIMATNGTIGGKWVDLVKYQPVSFTNPVGQLFFQPRGQIDVQTIQQPSKTVLLP